MPYNSTLNQWFVPKDRLPPEYELVKVAYDNGKEQMGWWTGVRWDSGIEKRGEEVIAWRKEKLVNHCRCTILDAAPRK